MNTIETTVRVSLHVQGIGENPDYAVYTCLPRLENQTLEPYEALYHIHATMQTYQLVQVYSASVAVYAGADRGKYYHFYHVAMPEPYSTAVLW